MSLDSEVFRAGAMFPSLHVVELVLAKCALGSKLYLLFNGNNTFKAHLCSLTELDTAQNMSESV